MGSEMSVEVNRWVKWNLGEGGVLCPTTRQHYIYS